MTLGRSGPVTGLKTGEPQKRVEDAFAAIYARPTEPENVRHDRPQHGHRQGAGTSIPLGQ
jgi:hypothetical protein